MRRTPYRIVGTISLLGMAGAVIAGGYFFARSEKINRNAPIQPVSSEKMLKVDWAKGILSGNLFRLPLDPQESLLITFTVFGEKATTVRSATSVLGIGLSILRSGNKKSSFPTAPTQRSSLGLVLSKATRRASRVYPFSSPMGSFASTQKHFSRTTENPRRCWCA